jgi:hypothetical protein
MLVKISQDEMIQIILEELTMPFLYQAMQQSQA